jgi:hypothetical protein
VGGHSDDDSVIAAENEIDNDDAKDLRQEFHRHFDSRRCAARCPNGLSCSTVVAGFRTNNS